MRIKSIHSFLFLSIFLAEYVSRWKESDSSHIFIFIGLSIYIVVYSAFSFLKRNDVSIWALWLITILFSELRGEFVKYSTSFFVFLSMLGLLFIVSVIDFLLLRIDIDRKSKFIL